jgi:hypothetical protein
MGELRILNDAMLQHGQEEFIARIEEFAPEDIPLLLRTFIGFGLGPSLFYLEIERFLGLNMHLFTGSSLVDLLDCLHLLQGKIRTKIFFKLDEALEANIGQLQPQERIRALEIFQCQAIDQYRSRTLLLGYFLGLENLSQLDLEDCLKLAHVIDSRTEHERLMKELNRRLLEFKESDLSQVPIKTLFYLASFFSNKGYLERVDAAIKDKIYNYVTETGLIVKLRSPNLVARVCNTFDVEWDAGMYTKEEFLEHHQKLLTAMLKELRMGRPQLKPDESLAVSNFFAKFCSDQLDFPPPLRHSN